ncbi:Secreted protein [Mycobacterium sp. smrl_JER01]
MHRMARIALTALAVLAASGTGVLGGGAATAEPAASARTVTLPFAQTLRRCDFTEFNYVGGSGYARPTGTVRIDGREMVADIQIATAVPNTRYDVRLIQVPRSSAASCTIGDPGVSGTVLFTDAAGAGATTVRGPIVSGATGVWAAVTRPSAYSQTPAEFYTTDLVVAF